MQDSTKPRFANMPRRLLRVSKPGVEELERKERAAKRRREARKEPA